MKLILEIKKKAGLDEETFLLGSVHDGTCRC